MFKESIKVYHYGDKYLISQFKILVIVTVQTIV
jgi:hypothetical protein